MESPTVQRWPLLCRPPPESSVSSHHQHLQGLASACNNSLLSTPPTLPWVLKTLPDPTPRGAKCTPSSQETPLHGMALPLS